MSFKFTKPVQWLRRILAKGSHYLVLTTSSDQSRGSGRKAA